MRKVKTALRGYLFTGILTVLPIVVTYYLLQLLYNKFTGFMRKYVVQITDSMSLEVGTAVTSILSLMLLVAIVLFVGFVTRLYLGRLFLDILDNLVARIPIARGIYKAVKQIADSFSSGSSNFKKVVLIRYPSNTSWTVGFVTSDTASIVACHLNEPCYNVFVPTTPNPTSGFILIVPVKDAVELDMSVEDGIKFVISTGLVAPKNVGCQELPK